MRTPEEKSPLGYELVKVIDTVHNKKEAAVVNTLSCFIIVLMILLGAFLFGFDRLERMLTSDEPGVLKWFLFRTAVILVMAAVYVVLHEGVHVAFIKLMKKGAAVSFRYKFFYATVGCDEVFSKVEYLLVCVAPVLILGVILTALCIVVAPQWQWPIYIIQVLNLSSAAGDIFIFSILSRMPKNILVRDNGAKINVYASTE
ncbi:MAG: DUF3267 domain-containing protein [Acutalibacteraceae bacterium]